MGNIRSSLSAIAAENCKVTYSFGNGRGFSENIAPSVAPQMRIEPRANAGLVTAAFNNDLTDCVEVFTPFSAFSHLGNGQGLFRSARALARPYFETDEPSPIMLKAVLTGLQTFQEKIADECKDQLNKYQLEDDR